MTTKPATKHSAKSHPGRRATDKAPAEHDGRSAAAARTWADKGVAKARAVRSKVRVAGVEYRSTLAAFKALSLPETLHIAFRIDLKATGRKVFTTDAGVKHIFTLSK